MTGDDIAAILARAQNHAAAGEFDAARALCNKVFEVDPGVIGALQTYMSITRVGPDDAVLARLRTFAAQSALPAGLRSQLWFMLGKGLDDIGDIAGAFAAFKTANALKHQGFDGAGQQRLVNDLIAATRKGTRIALSQTAPRMVFVIGVPRSGTSLLAQILGAHPGMASLGEVTALGDAVVAQSGGPLQLARAPSHRALMAVRRAYLEAIAPQGNAPVLIDKMPENYWLAWLIPMLFPDAVIVNIRRDPLATCWSCFRNDFGQGHGYSTDFPTLWAHYGRYAQMMQAWQGPERIDLHLDDVVANPAGALAPVLARLSLPWDDKMAKPQDTGSAVRTLSKWQARQGIDAQIASGWRAYLPLIKDEWGLDGALS